MAEGAPYCIENDLRGPENGPIGDIQRPPSYFEVIGFFDPPPSYNDISGSDSCNQQQPDPNQQVCIEFLLTTFALRIFKGIILFSNRWIFYFWKTYDNVVLTIDELPPPFMEGNYIKSGEKIVVDDPISETSAISISPNTAVTVIPGQEGHQDGSNS